MKLEPNMYVRTKKGTITKIKLITKTTNYGEETVQTSFICEDNNIYDCDKNCMSDDILKVSHNIIDLIEVGDYVNGDKVIYTNDGYFEVGEESDNIGFTSDKFIKSIVTKQQFESMQYKIEE